MKRSRFIYITTVLLIAATAAVLAVWYNSSHDTPSKPGSPQTPAATSPPTDSTRDGSSQSAKTYPVLVYFSKHPDSDDDPSKTFPVQRTSPDLGVARFAISELLKGPSAAEKTQGYFSTANLRNTTSICGGQDFTLTINDKIAKLQFCRTFDHLGSVADGQADTEIKATLKQFSTVSKVIILNSQGSCEFDLSGMNLCLQ